MIQNNKRTFLLNQISAGILLVMWFSREESMNKNKKFDAVKMMRDIREKLSEKYWKHPDILKKERKAIKKNIASNSKHHKIN